MYFILVKKLNVFTLFFDDEENISAGSNMHICMLRYIKSSFLESGTLRRTEGVWDAHSGTSVLDWKNVKFTWKDGAY